jgi:hypothetical protein
MTFHTGMAGPQARALPALAVRRAAFDRKTTWVSGVNTVCSLYSHHLSKVNPSVRRRQILLCAGDSGMVLTRRQMYYHAQHVDRGEK